MTILDSSDGCGFPSLLIPPPPLLDPMFPGSTKNLDNSYSWAQCPLGLTLSYSVNQLTVKCSL